MVSVPSPSSVHVRLSPQVPLAVVAANADTGNRLASSRTHSRTLIIFFIVFLLIFISEKLFSIEQFYNHPSPPVNQNHMLTVTKIASHFWPE